MTHTNIRQIPSGLVKRWDYWKPKETTSVALLLVLLAGGFFNRNHGGIKTWFLSSKFYEKYCNRFWTNTGWDNGQTCPSKEESTCLAWENFALLTGHSCTNHSQQHNTRDISVTEPPGGSLGQDVAKSKNLARSPCVVFFLFNCFKIQGASFLWGFSCVFFDPKIPGGRLNMIMGLKKRFEDTQLGRLAMTIPRNQQTAIWDEGGWV